MSKRQRDQQGVFIRSWAKVKPTDTLIRTRCRSCGLDFMTPNLSMPCRDCYGVPRRLELLGKKLDTGQAASLVSMSEKELNARRRAKGASHGK